MVQFHKHYVLKRNLLIALSVVLFVFMYFLENSTFWLRTLSTIAVLSLFYILDKFFDAQFKQKHYVMFILLVLTGFLFSPLYFIFPQWDKLQHFFGPILMASIIFYMINKITMQHKWKLAYTFFTVIAILAIFEIGEYLLDYLFGLRLQGVYLRDFAGIDKFNLLVNPLDDTMQDLCFGILGTSIYCIFKSWNFRKNK